MCTVTSTLTWVDRFVAPNVYSNEHTFGVDRFVAPNVDHHTSAMLLAKPIGCWPHRRTQRARPPVPPLAGAALIIPACVPNAGRSVVLTALVSREGWR
eukprot:1195739-Prorocentrum_minimum.AAC.7